MKRVVQSVLIFCLKNALPKITCITALCVAQQTRVTTTTLVLMLNTAFFLHTPIVMSNSNAPCSHHNVLVANMIELNGELDKACSGSIIRLASGIWKDVLITIENSGSEVSPIILTADVPGETFIEGASYIHAQGDYVHIIGFYFRNGQPGGPNLLDNPTAAITTFGSHSLISQNTIDNFNGSSKKAKWVNIYGQFSEVSYNRFKNKKIAGSLLNVMREFGDKPQYHHIHHNHFKNFASGKKENGWETLRIGTSKFSQSDSFTIVENNRFDHCDGETEIISVKSGKNTIRNNTFVDSQGLLTLRHGKNNLVENNIFTAYNKKHGGGIRILDDGHIVRNNYVAGVRTTSNMRGGIVVHSGVNKPNTRPKYINQHWTPSNITIENNTIVDSQNSILFDGKMRYGGSNVTFRNNVILSADNMPVIRMDKSATQLKFINELYSGATLIDGANVKFNPTKGITFTDDIVLKKNKDGLWLHETSGAQNLNYLRENDVGPTLY